MRFFSHSERPNLPIIWALTVPLILWQTLTQIPLPPLLYNRSNVQSNKIYFFQWSDATSLPIWQDSVLSRPDVRHFLLTLLPYPASVARMKCAKHMQSGKSYSRIPLRFIRATLTTLAKYPATTALLARRLGWAHAKPNDQHVLSHSCEQVGLSSEDATRSSDSKWFITFSDTCHSNDEYQLTSELKYILCPEVYHKILCWVKIFVKKYCLCSSS